MKAAILAISAIIGMTACNREAKRDANDASAKTAEEARQTNRDVKEGADNAANSTDKAAADTRDEAAKAADKDHYNNSGTSAIIDSLRGEKGAATGKATEGGKTASGKVNEESRQSTRDVKEGAQTVGGKIQEEARQTTRDVGDVVGGDKGVTEADKKTLTRLRAALKDDKKASKDADDVKITVDNGKVRLHGTVASPEAKKEIARVAGKVAGGASKVSDEMKVTERVGAGSND
ncbi:MAG: hypothetical protein JWP91_2824 [Fibrobacteres bacterium]|nr:hypothetical protein [Fibrobacterota bacterium]